MSDRDLTPEEEAEVTRMLADLPPVQMPESVQARLEDVLAGLVADRPTEREDSGLAEVVPLRRRRWPQVLVAAAAVSLFGYAGSALLQSQSADDRSTAGATDDSAPESAPENDGAKSLGNPEKGPAATDHDSGGDPSAPQATGNLAEGRVLNGLRDVTIFAAELDRTKASLSYRVADDLLVTAGKAGEYSFRRAAAGCDVPALNATDKAYDVRLGNKRAVVVVLRKVNANAARADVYPCKRPFLPVGSTFVLGVR